MNIKEWAKAYHANPNANPSTSTLQALAIKIHALMSDGEWRTTTKIADELGESIYAVRDAMRVIREEWGYEAVPSRNKGYRRIK